MRMFVAVVPPETVREDLDEFLSVRRDAARLRRTLAEHFHLTLAFCPDVAEHRRDDLAEHLAEAVAKRARFEARVSGGGVFPDPSRAKVLYAGLSTSPAGAEQLSRLAVGARNAAVRSGAEVDGQRFRPHLTVARSARGFEATNWVRLLDAYEGPRWCVDEIQMIGSYLGQGPGNRPRYETLATLPLG